MGELNFVVFGQPVPKARPRLGKGRVFTPAKTARYEAAVKTIAKSAMAGRKPMTGALNVSINIFLPKPKRPKSSAPITRPDVDNYAKGILDAMNEVVWLDDAQVVSLYVTKRYDEDPRAMIRVEES